MPCDPSQPCLRCPVQPQASSPRQLFIHPQPLDESERLLPVLDVPTAWDTALGGLRELAAD